MTERLAFSIKEVAEQVGVSTATVYRAINKGYLPISKLGRRTCIRGQDVEEWLLAGRTVREPKT